MKIDFEKLSDFEIIQNYSRFINELRRRNIIRSKNIIGDLGEHFAIEYYNKTPNLPKLQRAPQGTQNVDALSKNGDRYSIKATTGKVTGVFYGLPPQGSDKQPEKKFEYVIIVKFSDTLGVERICELTWTEFLKHKKWHSRMQAWNLPVTKKLLDIVKPIYIQSKDPAFK